MIEKRPFIHSGTVAVNSATVFFVVPEQLERFELNHIIIKENAILHDAGGAVVSISEMCSGYSITDAKKLHSELVFSSTPAAGGVVESAGMFRGSKLKFENTSVAGGDSLFIELDLRGAAGAVAEIAICGVKVGEF